KLIIVFLLLMFEGDKLRLYSFLLLMISLLVAIAYITFSCKHFTESRIKFFYEKIIYKELLSYSSWSLFGNIAVVAKGQGINVLLNLFFGPIINAAYGIMLQVQTAVSLFLNN